MSHILINVQRCLRRWKRRHGEDRSKQNEITRRMLRIQTKPITSPLVSKITTQTGSCPTRRNFVVGGCLDPPKDLEAKVGLYLGGLLRIKPERGVPAALMVNPQSDSEPSIPQSYPITGGFTSDFLSTTLSTLIHDK